MQKILKDAIKAFNLTKLYLPSLYGGFKNRKLFEGVKTYCMFIGYPKSGHSLIGALLEAHPDMVVSHELDALMYVYAQYSKRQIYYLILENSCRHATAGRKSGKFSYAVRNQWQGKFNNLQIIGDKKAEGTTLRLRKWPWLLSKLHKKLDINIKFLHVIRNPYDIISTLSKSKKRRKLKLNDSINHFFSLCETIQKLKRQIRESELLELRHETFIEDPKTLLRDVCQFLGTETPVDYLNDCANIVYKTPHKSRYDTQWSRELIDIVKNRMEIYPFLQGVFL